MQFSQKCEYAMRAIFELAKRYGKGPVKISEIAEVQAIPLRFLEVILSELKQGGFVTSKRGSAGGYLLSGPPRALSVGGVIRFVEGPVGPVPCLEGSSQGNCSLYANCVFLPLWKEVQRAICDIYDNTTFEDLVEQEQQMLGKHVASYSI